MTVFGIATENRRPVILQESRATDAPSLPAGTDTPIQGCKAHSCRYWTVTLIAFSSLLSPVVGSQTLLVAIWMA
jgi:hypothetical protein